MDRALLADFWTALCRHTGGPRLEGLRWRRDAGFGGGHRFDLRLAGHPRPFVLDVLALGRIVGAVDRHDWMRTGREIIDTDPDSLPRPLQAFLGELSLLLERDGHRQAHLLEDGALLEDARGPTLVHLWPGAARHAEAAEALRHLPQGPGTIHLAGSAHERLHLMTAMSSRHDPDALASVVRQEIVADLLRAAGRAAEARALPPSCSLAAWRDGDATAINLQGHGLRFGFGPDAPPLLLAH